MIRIIKYIYKNCLNSCVEQRFRWWNWIVHKGRALWHKPQGNINRLLLLLALGNVSGIFFFDFWNNQLNVTVQSLVRPVVHIIQIETIEFCFMLLKFFSFSQTSISNALYGLAFILYFIDVFVFIARASVEIKKKA